MTEVRFLTPATRYLKKLKDNKLKRLYQETIERIREDHTIGEAKQGDLSGICYYDIFYDKTNYELAYRVQYVDDKKIIVIMAATRENFYEEMKKGVLLNG